MQDNSAFSSNRSTDRNNSDYSNTDYMVPSANEYTMLLYQWLSKELSSDEPKNLDTEFAREVVITLSERLPYYRDKYGNIYV